MIVVARLLVASALACALAFESPGEASAQPNGTVTAAIKKQATLSDSTVLLTVMTRCPAGAQVLEAFAYVTQNGQTSQFGGLSLVCDGKPHRIVVTIRSFEEAPFHAGGANATTYALVQRPDDGSTVQGGDTGAIVIRSA